VSRSTVSGIAALLAGLSILVGARLGRAQSNLSTGTLIGTTTKVDGSVLPGVEVTASRLDTGLRRWAVSDDDGAFRIDQLPPGEYSVRAECAGFRSEEQAGVPLTLGSRIVIGFLLSPSAVEDEIVITAEEPVVETSSSSVAASVSDVAIANLPLKRRDFTDLVLLTPASVLSDEEQVGGGRGSVNIGARAIQNSYNIDGANNQSSFWGEERGGILPPFTFSQAAIKEFQVIKSAYDMQFSAGGGVINAVTKSGTNELHGEVFGFFTDDGLSDEDALGRKEDSKQIQYGFALGGPVVRDRLHFFTSVDRQDFDIPHYTEFRDFPDGRESDWESLTGLDLAQETANYGATNDATALLLKLDWQAGDNHLLTARYAYSEAEALNQFAPYTNSGRSNNGTEQSGFDSLVLSANSVVSERVLNEAFLQYAIEQRPRAPNNDSIPEGEIYLYRATWGQNASLPNWLDEERWQIVDNLSVFLGAHSLKLGLNIDLVEFDNAFLACRAGCYSFEEWEGEDVGFLDGGMPFSYFQTFSDSNGQVVFSNDYWVVFAQDEWRAKPDLTLSYGLRYELQRHDEPQEVNPEWPPTGQIPDDTDNWSLRAGFAWDVGGDGRSVLRGGVGRFYDVTPTVFEGDALLNNGIRTLPVFRICRFEDCPQWPDSWDDVGDVEGVPPDIAAFDPGFENPQTDRVSLGYERQVGRELSLGIDLIYSVTDKLQRSQDQNMTPTGEMTPDGRPIYGPGPYPQFRRILHRLSDADGDYRAVILKARKRFSNGWFLDASYTWSEARDTNSNERAVSVRSSLPEDQYNLENDRGPSNFDIVHKLVLSFSWQLPYRLTLSAIGFYRSGYPYSALDARDNNRDTYRNERALYETEPGVWVHPDRNTERNGDYTTVDLRLSWVAGLGRGVELELIGEAFNVLGSANWYTSSTNWVLVNRDGSINPDFGVPDEVGPPRHFQVGARLRF
jgi:hypothetical protein